MFPVDEELAVPPPLRICSDCRIEMAVRHHGRFVTMYVCPTCGVNVTVPKPFLNPKSNPKSNQP